MKTKMYIVPHIQKCIIAFLLVFGVIFSSHADATRFRDSMTEKKALVAVAGLHELSEEVLLHDCSGSDIPASRQAANMAPGLKMLQQGYLTLIESVENGSSIHAAVREIQLEANRETFSRLLNIIFFLFILTCLSHYILLLFSRCFHGRLSFMMLIAGTIMSFIHSQDGMKN